MTTYSVANFLVLDWGDIAVWHRLHRLAGRYDNPMPESTISPSQGLRILLLIAIPRGVTQMTLKRSYSEDEFNLLEHIAD